MDEPEQLQCVGCKMLGRKQNVVWFDPECPVHGYAASQRAEREAAEAARAEVAEPKALYRCLKCGRNEHGCECEGGGDMERAEVAEPGDGHRHGRPWCPACVDHGMVLAQDDCMKAGHPGAATAGREPLDALRLERAYLRVVGLRADKVEVIFRYGDRIPVEVQRQAFLREIAREYAALDTPDPGAS